MKETNLDNILFRRWWIRKNCHEILEDPLLQPTEEDWDLFIDELLEKEMRNGHI